jgi:hypothetical protein
VSKIVLTRKELDRRMEIIAPSVRHSDYKEVAGGWDDDSTVKLESFDTVVAKGPVVFRRTFAGWQSTVPVNDPTVADVLRAMETSMKETGDEHHVFFEGYKVVKKHGDTIPCGHCGRGGGEPVTFIDIHTGS